jgi:hypothetical protein
MATFKESEKETGHRRVTAGRRQDPQSKISIMYQVPQRPISSHLAAHYSTYTAFALMTSSDPASVLAGASRSTPSCLVWPYGYQISYHGSALS